MENEIVKVMALRVLREISQSIQTAPFFSILVDEMTDVSNVEQVVVCLRWVSETLKVQEDIVGLWHSITNGRSHWSVLHATLSFLSNTAPGRLLGPSP